MSDAETASRRCGTAVRVVGLQLAASMAAAALALMWSFDDAKSALLGGLVALLPNAYFAWVLVRSERNADVQHPVGAAARVLGQWAAKVAMTATLLVLAIMFVEPAAFAFVCGFAAALLAPLGAALVRLPSLGQGRTAEH